MYRDFCEECPHKQWKKAFRKQTEEMLFKFLGHESRRFKFDQLLSLVYDVRNLEDTPSEKMTVKMNVLLGMYLKEKRYVKKYLEYREGLNRPK